jgi:hypothetical protein
MSEVNLKGKVELSYCGNCKVEVDGVCPTCGKNSSGWEVEWK